MAAQTVIVRSGLQVGKAKLPVGVPLAFYDQQIADSLVESGQADLSDDKPKLTITKKMIELGHDPDADAPAHTGVRTPA